MESTVRFNSLDRGASSSSTTDYDVHLKFPIEASNSGSQAAVMAATIPLTWYNIDAGSDRMDFIENIGVAAAAALTVGFYDAITILPMIKVALEAASPNTRTYTVTIDAHTGLMSVAVSAGTVSWRNITGATAGRFPFKLTGLPADETTASGTLVGTAMFNALLHTSLYISSNFNDGSPGSQTTGVFSAIARIDVQGSAFGDIISYRNTQQERFRLFGRQNNVHVMLLDESGLVVDLNGANWQFDLAYNA